MRIRLADELVEPLLQSVAEASGAAMAISVDGAVAFATRRFEQLSGFSNEELRGRPLAQIAHQDSRDLVESRVRAQTVNALPEARDRVQLTTRSGLSVPTEMATSHVEYGERRLVLSTFWGGEGPDAIARMTLTGDWTIVQANVACARLLGFDDVEQATGRLFTEFCQDWVLLSRLLATYRARGEASPCEVEITNARGERFAGAVMLTGDARDTSCFCCSVLSATDPAEIRRNHLGAERMSAIGRLAGGIAHDFNNLLTVVGGHADTVLERSATDQVVQQSAMAIREAARRAASLTRQLLAFGRRQALRPEPVALDRFIREIVATLLQALGQGIDLRLKLSPDLPDVSVDRSQLGNALTSLMTNAREAMPAGGRVSIKVDTVSVGPASTRPRPWIPVGSYVRLIVEDNGRGMDADTRSHVFEPYFSSKGVGQGSGLGLADVYGFVRQSNGHIFADSEPNRGASFTLLFPDATDAALAGSLAATSAGRGRRHETILVVDNNEQFRRRLAGALREQGYLAMDAPCNHRAVDMLNATTERVDLLVIDDATCAAEEPALMARLLSVANVPVPVLHMESGAPAGVAVVAGRLRMEKPANPEAVAEQIRRILDA